MALIRTNRVARIVFGSTPFKAEFLVKALQQLPEDALVIGAQADYASMGWAILFQSEEYDPVDEGAKCPSMTIKVDGIKKTVELIQPGGSFMKELKSL